MCKLGVISQERLKIEVRLLLSANRKSYGFVRPVREKSIYWHNIWSTAGRPKTATLADIMRQTRAAYHYAIRRIKSEEDDIVKERFAATVTRERNRDFWTEVRKIASKTAGTLQIQIQIKTYIAP